MNMLLLQLFSAQRMIIQSLGGEVDNLLSNRDNFCYVEIKRAVNDFVVSLQVIIEQ